MANSELKQLVEAPASHDLVRKLLSVPASGKTIKAQLGKKWLTIRVRPATDGSSSAVKNDK